MGNGVAVDGAVVKSVQKKCTHCGKHDKLPGKNSCGLCDPYSDHNKKTVGSLGVPENKRRRLR